MSDSSNDRLDRIERMLENLTIKEPGRVSKIDYLTDLLAQTAERQSTVEHQIQETKKSIAELLRALEIDSENIRRLANIAAAH